MSGEPYAGCEESMMGKEQEDIFYTTSESKFALDEGYDSYFLWIR